MIDVAIVGAGPAGLTAAIYAARSGCNTVIFEELMIGGQLASIDRLENYPGFPDGIAGYDIASQLYQQAQRFGAEVRYDKIISFTRQDFGFDLETARGHEQAKTIIIATGARPAKLETPDLSLLEGRGVSFCATCDGNFFANQQTAIIGGGDTACADALYLSRICSHVHLIHRRDTLRANPWYAKALSDLSNVTIHWNSILVDVQQTDNRLSGITIEDINTLQQETLACSGLFMAIGAKPQSEWLKGTAVALNEKGYVIAGETCETSIPGIFVAGDVRTTPLGQVITAASDGAIAAEAAVKFLT